MKKELVEWANEYMNGENGKALMASDTFACLFSTEMLREPACILQMGMAVCADKPIVLIVDRETRIPENIRRVALCIEVVDREDKAGFEAAVKRALGAAKADIARRAKRLP